MEKKAKTFEDEEIIFCGEVIELEPARMGHPHIKWRVTLRVDSLLAGDFTEDLFVFGIHSPEKSGIALGRKYRIRASGESPTELIVKKIDPVKNC